MILLSELISKRVISIAEAKDEGTVLNALFNPKLTQVTFLKLFTDSESDTEVRYLDYKKIKSVSENAITINDSSAISFDWNTGLNSPVTLNPINLECFNQDGKMLGYVKDIELDGAKVASVLIGESKIAPSNVLSISANLIIINDTDKPIKLKKAIVKMPKPTSKTEQEAKIHFTPNVEPNLERNVISSDTNQESKQVPRPPRVPPSGTVTPDKPDYSASPYKFLLGKTLMRDINLDNGELLFLAKTIITKEIISTAREKGKLVQLALHAE